MRETVTTVAQRRRNFVWVVIEIVLNFSQKSFRLWKQNLALSFHTWGVKWCLDWTRLPFALGEGNYKTSSSKKFGAQKSNQRSREGWGEQQMRINLNFVCLPLSDSERNWLLRKYFRWTRRRGDWKTLSVSNDPFRLLLIVFPWLWEISARSVRMFAAQTRRECFHSAMTRHEFSYGTLSCFFILKISIHRFFFVRSCLSIISFN